MKRVLSLVFGFSLVCVIGAGEKAPGELTDPLEIVKKVDAATKAVTAAKYHVVYEGLGEAAAITGKVEADVTAVGFAGTMPEKYVMDAKVTLPGKTSPLHITIGSDSETFYAIHHDTKTAYVDIDPAVIGDAGRILGRALMIEFTHPTPFSDEINATSRELRGSKMIDGQDCYEIHVVYAVPQAPQATWYFSKKDFLPRARIDTAAMPDGRKLQQQKVISGLEANPKLDDAAFKFKLPAGYKQTDDFAPNILPSR